MDSDDIILVADDRRVSRAAYKDRVARAVSVLGDLGVGPGDRVGIALRNCPEFFELMAAAGVLKARVVPIAWRLKHDEVRYLVEDSRARIVFVDAASAGHLTGLPILTLDDYEHRLGEAEPAINADGGSARTEMELYSSGTTGRPKAIERDMPAPSRESPAPRGSLAFLDMLGVGEPGEVH